MSCDKHDKETEREEFLQKLRELVIYTLPKECRDDEDIVEFYFQSFLLACEEYKNI
jgi:hypothetical protein